MATICEFSAWVKVSGWAQNKEPGRSHAKPAAMAAYQGWIADAGRVAMAGELPYVAGLVRLEVDVFHVTPADGHDLDYWGPTVEPDGKGGYVKRGPAIPDLTNVLKATEDALEGIVYGDDAQVSIQATRRVYGPREGVTVRVYAL